MRVVMLTDDVQIDRRILQEAHTLIGAGHEVIVLARGEGEPYAHERIGGIKIERIAPGVDGGRERLVQRAAAPALARLERLRSSNGSRSVAVLERSARVAVSQTVRLVRRTRRLPYRDAVLADRARYYRPDVLHAHDLPQLLAATVVARSRGVPVVYDAHELYPVISSLRPRLRKRLARLEARLIGRCDAVITVNPYLAQEFARRYSIAVPTVILNAVDPSGRAGHTDPIRPSLGLPADTRIVLYQGWLSAERGLVRLVDALAHVPDDVHLVYLGYGEAGSTVVAHADRAGLGDRVHVLDAVPQAELPIWTAAADVGVIPYPDIDLNHRYCSPNKLFEFIQASVPVVANDLPYLRDVIVGESIGEVALIEDAHSFGLAIARVLDADRHAVMVERSREVAPRYSWAAQEAALLEAYRPFDEACRRGRP